MVSFFRWLSLVMGLLLVAGSSPGQSGLGVGNPRPVDVSIDLFATQFAIGEPVSMTVRTDRDAWVYVFSTDAHGTTRQIFPNGHHRDNHVRGVRSVRLPSSGYALMAMGPEGNATISAFATTQQFDWLRLYDLVDVSGEAFPVRLMSPVQFRARLEESIAASNRALNVPRQSVPSRAALSGSSSVVQTSSAWRLAPACGYATRSIRIMRPAPRIGYPNGFVSSHSGSGSSFYFSDGRGAISSGRTIYRPSRVTSYDPPIHHYPSYQTPSYFRYDPLCPPGYSPPSYYPRPDQQPSYRPPDGRPVRLTTTTVRSTPAGADVYLDGRYWGQTPLTVRIPPGSYSMRVERRGYLPEYQTVRVREGRTESLRVTLRRDRR